MQDNNEAKSVQNEFGRPPALGLNKRHSRKNKSMAGVELSQRANEDFVSFLEHKLEEIENKLKKT